VITDVAGLLSLSLRGRRGIACHEFAKFSDIRSRDAGEDDGIAIKRPDNFSNLGFQAPVRKEVGRLARRDADEHVIPARVG
jgi:hypothetical protein